MLKKLSWVLKSLKGSQLLTVLKAIIFAGLFGWARVSWFGFFIFLTAAFYFYFGERLDSRRFLGSFSVLILASVLVINSAFFYESPGFWMLLLYLGALYWAILGLKNLVFLHRAVFYYVLNVSLFFFVFVLFFSAEAGPFAWFWYLISGFMIFLLLREFLAFNLEVVLGSEQFLSPLRRTLTALTLDFLFLELLWVVALMSLGFLNSAILSLVFVLFLGDLMFHNWTGSLSRKTILRDASVFLVLNILIFGLSKLSL